MLDVRWPAGMLPLLIDHRYVTPVASVDAVLPAELAHAALLPLMVGVDGSGLMVVLLVLVVEHPALVTASVRPTLPLAPAVYVMLDVPWPAVMLPLLIDHRYVTPVASVDA